MAKIALAYMHIVAENGTPLILTPGDQVPVELEDQVTNPEAFSEHTDATDTPVTDPDAPVGSDGVPPSGAPEAPPVTPDGPPSEPVTPGYDRSTEPESDKPYGERAFKSLQAAAKARDLNGSGKAEDLVLKLEADDRDRANQE